MRIVVNPLAPTLGGTEKKTQRGRAPLHALMGDTHEVKSLRGLIHQVRVADIPNPGSVPAAPVLSFQRRRESRKHTVDCPTALVSAPCADSCG